MVRLAAVEAVAEEDLIPWEGVAVGTPVADGVRVPAFKRLRLQLLLRLGRYWPRLSLGNRGVVTRRVRVGIGSGIDRVDIHPILSRAALIVACRICTGSGGRLAISASLCIGRRRRGACFGAPSLVASTLAGSGRRARRGSVRHHTSSARRPRRRLRPRRLCAAGYRGAEGLIGGGHRVGRIRCSLGLENVRDEQAVARAEEARALA